MAAAGLATSTAQAEALGVHYSTALRVGAGSIPPSTSIIARALLLLGCRFEELFEIVEDA